MVAAVVQLGKAAATDKAFALHGHGEAVVTWAIQKSGGDSSQVREQLRNVQHIQATARGAFAAILESGSVVTWGDPEAGGDSSQVQERLRNVQRIQATANGSLAAILESGAVVTWGNPGAGGDQPGATADQARSAHPGNWGCFCCHSCICSCCDLGFSTSWRRQQPGARPAENRPAHPSN